MRLRHILLALVIVGCGNDKPKVTTHDSNMQTVDAPPLPPGCDYAELTDNANDNGIAQGATGVSEDTGTAGIGKVFCGNVDMTHYDTTSQILDVDSFQFTLAADGAIRADLVGTGLEALDDAEILITDGNGANIAFDGSGVFLTDHGVAVAGLTAGTYSVALFTAAAAAPTSTAPLPYKIKITTFTNACTAATGTATHTEGATDNDVLTEKYSTSTVTGFRHETIKTTDAFEPSAITLAANTNVSISGTMSATAAIDADDYLDRDTFEFASSAGVNEVTIRLDWANKMADLDLYLLAKRTAPLTAGTNWGFLAASNADSGVGAAGMGGPELFVTAIDASTPWWIWNAAYTGSTGLPSPYTVTICPTHVTP